MDISEKIRASVLSQPEHLQVEILCNIISDLVEVLVNENVLRQNSNLFIASDDPDLEREEIDASQAALIFYLEGDTK